MRGLFDEIESVGLPALERLVDSRQQETITLDFKRKTKHTQHTFDTGDRRCLGQALSGFANSAGGILIWGIDARRGPDDVDCAQSLHPIQEIDRFAGEATSLISQLVLPRHDGIRIAKIEDPNHKGAGYVAIDIPRSDRRPHRSEAKGEKQYFKRVGDSFVTMEHYDIEDAFNRKTSGSIDFSYILSRHPGVSGPSGIEYRYKITILLKNDSLYSAKFPYVFLSELQSLSKAEWGLDGNGYNGLAQIPTTGSIRFAGGADVAIHPGMDWPITILEFKARHASREDSNINGKPPKETVVSFRYECGCENAPRRTGVISLTAADWL